MSRPPRGRAPPRGGEGSEFCRPRAFSAPPRRSVNGIDLNRLHMLVAVLERRARLDLGGDDVFVNAAGGVRLTEPAADLAVALALASNKRNPPAGAHLVALGELGLSGGVRRARPPEPPLPGAC